MAPPFRVVELDILFGSGIDTYGCLLDAAESVGVVERKGSWYNRGETRFAQGSVFTYRPYHWPIIIIISFYTNNIIFNSNKIIKRNIKKKIVNRIFFRPVGSMKIIFLNLSCYKLDYSLASVTMLIN